jgi:hypothetical protein
MPATAVLRTVEFATIRLRLLKIAARLIETAAVSALPRECPDAALHRSIALDLRAAGQ